MLRNNNDDFLRIQRAYDNLEPEDFWIDDLDDEDWEEDINE